MSNLQKYAQFIKLEHTLFSLPILYAGSLLARFEFPSFHAVMVIFLAGASARVVAVSLNRIIDREIDKKNPRTKERALPSGKMKLFEAWVVVTISLAIFFFSAWQLNDLCLKLSWIPILFFFLYPYFKRLTKWTHVGLGLVWALVPLGGYFAVNPSLNGILPVLFLSFFCVWWLAGFDIIYATLDEEFDRHEGVKSLPAAFGSDKALKISALFHVIGYLSLVALYVVWFSGPVTVMLLGLIGVLLVIEQTFSQYVDMAFFQINAVIGTLVFFFVLSGIKGF